MKDLALGDCYEVTLRPNSSSELGNVDACRNYRLNFSPIFLLCAFTRLLWRRDNGENERFCLYISEYLVITEKVDYKCQIFNWITAFS